VSSPAAKDTYSRSDLLRLLGIRSSRLRSWERSGLCDPQERYTFHDFQQLKSIARILGDVTKPETLRLAIEGIRKRFRDIGDPLKEARFIANGRKLTVEIGRSRINPVSGQFYLNFSEAESRVVAFQSEARDRQVAREKAQRQSEAQAFFEKGAQLENSNQFKHWSEVRALYQKALDLDPECASAAVNIGTLFYNYSRDLKEAEKYYKTAIKINPLYSLAHFNLGNVYDERADWRRAKQHYELAIETQPGYADAHYNLALLLQNLGQVMPAASHWQTFLKLDPRSDWAEVARRELAKLRRETLVVGQRDQNKCDQG
jgi:tetratricopeptide (TPR) repeat protein